MKIKNKRGQEEMVGFALIVIIVSVILLVFLGFYLGNSGNQSVQSYEAESFVQSALQYSTQCSDYYGYISVKDLIFMCDSEATCRGGEDSCVILNSTLSGILNQSWNIREGSSTKGYLLNITSNSENVLSIKEGNMTKSSEGSSQSFTQGTASVDILFNIFY
jgi:hypothetical protein